MNIEEMTREQIEAELAEWRRINTNEMDRYELARFNALMAALDEMDAEE